jgi:hypothetical protein
MPTIVSSSISSHPILLRKYTIRYGPPCFNVSPQESSRILPGWKSLSAKINSTEEQSIPSASTYVAAIKLSIALRQH